MNINKKFISTASETQKEPNINKWIQTKHMPYEYEEQNKYKKRYNKIPLEIISSKNSYSWRHISTLLLPCHPL